jgi:hypothetical protein
MWMPYCHCFLVCFEYAIWKVQENQEGVDLEVAYQFLLYSDVNLLGKKLNAMTNIDDSRFQSGIWSEVNREQVDILSPDCRTKP